MNKFVAFVLMTMFMVASVFSFYGFVEKTITSANTDTNLSSFDPTHQNGTVFNLTAVSNSTSDTNVTVSIKYMNSSFSKKTATLYLNGTTQVNGTQNYYYLVKNGTNVSDTVQFATNATNESSWNVSTGANTVKLTTFTATKVCYTATNYTGTCSSTDSVGVSNLTVYENDSIGSTYNFSVNITNAAVFGGATTFDLIVLGTFVQAIVDETDQVGIYLQNSSDDWVFMDNLTNSNDSTLSYTNITGLSVSEYAGSNVVEILFNHSSDGNATNTGIILDYIAGKANVTAIHCANYTNVVNYTTSEANYTWNGTKMTLDRTNMDNQDDGTTLQIIGETTPIGNITFADGTGFDSLTYWDGSQFVTVTDATNLGYCANASLRGPATKTLNTTQYTKADVRYNYDDVAYVYQVRAYHNNTLAAPVGHVNVSAADTVSGLLYYIEAGYFEPLASFYICPNTYCTLSSMYIAADAWAKFSVVLTSTSDVSRTAAAYITNGAATLYRPVTFTQGERMDIIGQGRLANTNTSLMYEVN